MQTALPFAFTFTAVRSTTKFEAVQFWGQTHGSDPMARAHGTADSVSAPMSSIATQPSPTQPVHPQPLHLLPATSSRRRPGPTQVSAISTRPGSRSTRATRSTCATRRPARLQLQPTSLSPRSSSGLSRGPTVEQCRRAQADPDASKSARQIRGWLGPRDKPEDDDLETFDFNHLVLRVSTRGAA